MQIHELNNYTGELDGGAYFAVDNGTDTGKVSTPQLLGDVISDLADINARIDNIIAGGDAPSVAEVTDARLGVNNIAYPSLGAAIRGQVTKLQDEILRLTTESENLFDPFSVTDGVYIASGGEIASQANSHISDYITVEGGEIYSFFLTHVPGAFYYAATYDSSKNFLARLNAYTYGQITLNNNVAYIRISFYDMDIPGDFTLVKGPLQPTKEIPHLLIDDSVIPVVTEKLNSIVRKSVNLFNIDTITKGKYQNASGGLNNEASSSISDYIPIEGGEAYTNNGDNVYWYIGTYDKDGTFIERLNAYSLPWTITFNANVAYIRISMYQHDFAPNFMIVKGNELPKEYEPYGYVLKEGAIQNIDNKVTVTKQSATSFLVQTGKGAHVLTHQTIAGKHLDTWRLTQGQVNSVIIWNDVDVEGPILEKDASDYMGGYHGDEIMTAATFIFDGVVTDPSTLTIGEIIKCDDFSVCVTSDIYYDGDSVNKAFVRYKRIVFEGDKVQIFNTYKFIGASPIEIDIATGTGLYPVSSSVADGYTTNTGNAYVHEATTNRNRDLDRVSFFGSNFTINIKVLFGKGSNYYGTVYYIPDQTRYKAYFYQQYANGSNYLTLNNGDELYSGYEIEFK